MIQHLVQTIWHVGTVKIESSLYSLISLSFFPEETLDPWLPTAPIKDSDQTVQMHSLIRIFEGHIFQCPSSINVGLMYVEST